MSDKTPDTGKSAKASHKAGKQNDMVSPGDAAAAGSEPTTPAQAPPEGLRALALDYPIALLAGGIVAGVLIGALLPRAGGRRFTKGAAALAGVAGELGLTYARKAIDNVSDAARTAAEAGGHVAENVGERTNVLLGTLRESTGEYSGKAADVASDATSALRHSAEVLARQVIRLTSQLRH